MKHFTWSVWLSCNFFNDRNLPCDIFVWHVNKRNGIWWMMDEVQCLKDKQSLRSHLKFDEYIMAIV